MKKPRFNPKTRKATKAACTVSAAALMLGVSHAATVAMHFQVNYCNYASYSGYPVTLKAFGVAPSGWQNLIEMNTGYTTCPMTVAPFNYTLNEVINTTTTTNGLNPLPNGSISVTWTANTANFSPFYGYAGGPPHYAGGGPLQNPTTGEQQIYGSFLRDGLNFGPPGQASNPTFPTNGYNVDITGLKSVFTNTPFVVCLAASSDSMQDLTNAFVIDLTHSTTNSVTYPSTPPVSDNGGAPWVRGNGGGLSTGTAAIDTDHLKIISNLPAHGTNASAGGYDHAGTVSAIIITDKPVVTMSPKSVPGNPGDSVALSMYAIGVPPLSYQWRRNGNAIAGATTTLLNLTNLGLSNEGNYDVVVTNAYGSATSDVSTVGSGFITMTPVSGLVEDAQTANPERNGVNKGATWLASSSDGSKTRNGVMQFVATNNTGITVTGSTNFDGGMGAWSFWMRSAGIDPTATGTIGASVFGRPGSTLVNDFIIAQEDSGVLLFNSPGGNNTITSVKNVSDNLWHHVVLTFDSSTNGVCSLYIDGALDGTNVNTAAWSAPVGAEWEFGFTTGATLRAYNGLLNDLRVYNRQLTPAEITSLYNTGAVIDANALQMELNFATAPVPGFSLSWIAPNSVLQSTNSVAGAFSDIPGAISPYNIVPKAGQKFYQFRYPSAAPVARISNPYLM